MKYANQIQEFIERSVNGCASGCTHWSHICASHLWLCQEKRW